MTLASWRDQMMALLLMGVVLPMGRAAEVPTPGTIDHRIRTADYNADQVYRITAFYGYAMTLVFAKTERIQHVVMGDPQAWDVKTMAHVLTLKPTAQSPDTSMVVMTDRHEYAFDLRAKPPRTAAAAQAEHREQSFLLRFRYPDDEAAQRAAAAAQERAGAQARQDEADRLEAERRVVANMPAKPLNRQYEYSGSRELVPTAVWDDGTFTYMEFGANQGVPAVYTLSVSGEEMIAPKHFDRHVMVVQRVARKVILRRDNLVTCLWNNGMAEREGAGNGASDPASARILRSVP